MKRINVTTRRESATVRVAPAHLGTNAVTRFDAPQTSRAVIANARPLTTTTADGKLYKSRRAGCVYFTVFESLLISASKFDYTHALCDTKQFAGIEVGHVKWNLCACAAKSVEDINRLMKARLSFLKHYRRERFF
ncbi:hypothetical protein EVAR_102101_1 [Eumeta japonica]|uniref:Uncharacterized protein n=1 Tax=Eumeta variegata TaxID=151549 RepID=A0A4C1TZP0_EUMVA|nr:hypothetical protein EVAR_102101_1 [Eumeta japonica]